MLIGIVGAFIGGFLGNMITGVGLNGFSLWSILLAVVGALLLLWIYRMTTRSRARLTAGRQGPDGHDGQERSQAALLRPPSGSSAARAPGPRPSLIHSVTA